MLRDLVRYRVQLGRQVAHVKTQLKQLIARQNIQAPYKSPFGPHGLYWFSRQELGPVGDCMRDHLLERLAQANTQLKEVDAQLQELHPPFPEVEALMDLRGVRLLTALMVVAEFDEVERFRTAKQGSPWLRWILVEGVMKVIGQDVKLANFYQRIRKRSSTKIARVAVARKLVEICWKRLRRWHGVNAPQTVAT